MTFNENFQVFKNSTVMMLNVVKYSRNEYYSNVEKLIGSFVDSCTNTLLSANFPPINPDQSSDPVI